MIVQVADYEFRFHSQAKYRYKPDRRRIDDDRETTRSYDGMLILGMNLFHYDEDSMLMDMMQRSVRHLAVPSEVAEKGGGGSIPVRHHERM